MILVVGGAGYIGSHVVRALRLAGKPHLVFDNIEQGHAVAVEGSHLFNGDLRREADVANVFTTYPDIDVVMHLAAYIAVGESVRDPGRYFRNNVCAVLNLLEGMRRAGVNKFVFSSTAAVFGEPQYLPLDEDHPFAPASPYGHTKLMVERILDSFDVAHGLKSVCLRYFNAAGADPTGAIGEDHEPESHLIPLAIGAASGKYPPLRIFGIDYDTPDGTCIRDYVHVCDLAKAHFLALDHLRSGGDSRKFNLGNGNGISVREILEAVERVTGMAVPANESPRRAGDPARLVASSARIEREWRWRPEYPGVDEIVGHAWNWHRSHPKGYGGV